MVYPNFHRISFPFTWMTSFNISWTVSLLAIILTYYVCKEKLNFALVLKDIFGRKKFQLESFFSFCTSKWLMHHLLTEIGSKEKTVFTFTFVSLYTRCYFFSSLFKIFSLSLPLDNFIMMCLGVVFCFCF